MVRWSAWLATVGIVAVVGAAVIWKSGMGDDSGRRGTTMTFADVVPVPHTVRPAEGASFTIRPGVAIVVDAEAARVGDHLAEVLGAILPARPSVRHGNADSTVGGGAIVLMLDPEVAVGDEGYQLDVTRTGVAIRGRSAAGLFWGVQTLRQLLPVKAQSEVVVAGGQIIDQPRYPYRGVMLDVARHFFDVAAIKRLIELSSRYKLNYLHLHLTDDQGWRIAIDGWPRLTTFGGGTEVGDGPGGYYTKAQYAEIVEHAARHFMTVVPEVDLPGHTNAALASYPELTCDGKGPQRYTGIEVGFSSLCAGNELTYRFVDEVFGELAAITPGPYLHLGGDEAMTLRSDDYATVVDRAQEIVVAHGKAPVGWHEVAAAKVGPSTVLQFWGATPEAPELAAAVAQGAKVIMSPANRAYLDMKYDESTRIGLSWAGMTSVEEAYDWDPAGQLEGVGESALLGVEAPLWTETVRTVEDIDYLAFPRLVAIAEIGWSPASTHDWATFRARLGAQAPVWEALGVGFYRAEEVPWVAG